MLRLMGAGKSARGNVQDPEQVFKAGIDRIADVVQKLCLAKKPSGVNIDK